MVNKKIVIRCLAALIILVAWAPYFHRVTSFKALSRLIFSHKPKDIQTFWVNSEYQDGASSIEVLLPKDYNPQKRYPVLYILPTVPQKWDFWWNGGLMEAFDNDIPNQYQVICVNAKIRKMPWFADHPTNKLIRQESYMVKTVVPFIDQQFSTITKSEGRFLVGISKSGTGAYTLLLRNPEIFGKACGYDAPLMSDTIHQVPGLKLEEIYGTDENFTHYFIPKLLSDHANYWQNQPPRIILLGYADLLNHQVQAHRYLNKLKIPHVYDVTNKRRHNWQCGWFLDAVKYLMG